MFQTILVGLLFLAALIYVIRYLCRNVFSGKQDGMCDKCVPGNRGAKN
jgi:hypothetical protein